ncbi:GNAT family N-acetyltransferase [Streptomyces sp. NBC_01754]|uniref:GNAT family N-acetyltransferase n=1 Tax=Streptomyces sp. NBC_01754 TaxID=2975930 RepID=UPI002DDC363B|nr:GNAT family N-acetyltransferase [Streptomyces sp. NBC_01754]WSC92780.1 GNAT family N-acetyltransferase [Streptomyces sp. NBC_01754]
MEPLTLTTERLLLRPFGPQDAEAVLTACQDPEIQRWTVVPSPYTRADAELFTRKLSPEGWADGTMYNFAVVSRQEDGPLVGALGVNRHSLTGTYEIGFWTGREHRGRGFTTEAVLAAARWSFTGLGADRLEWRAEIGNAPSRAVALRAGFRMEGDQRSALLNKGTRRDVWIGALIPADLGLPGTHPYLPAPDVGAAS